MLSGTMEKRDRLVEKRKKLEELKRAREARANNVKSTASMGAGAQSGGTTHQQMQHQQQQQMDIDNLLTSILKPGDSPVSGYLSPSTQGKDIQDGHTSPNTPDIGPSTPAGNLSEDEIELSRNATPSKQRNSPYPPQHSPLQRFSNLSVSSTARDTITATEKIYYTKETQTDSNWMDDEIEKQVQQRLADMEAAQKQKEAIEEEKRIAKEEAAAQARHEQELAQQDVNSHMAVLNPSESTAIIQTDSFARFFERTSKIAERSLYEIYDLAADYSALSKIDTTGESDDNQVTLRTTFGSAASHNGRACTDLNWSPHKLELFVCAYADTPRIGGPTNAEPDGIVAVWNVNVPSSPEFVFYCQSAVMSVSFSPYRPSLIVGTLYTGLIVVWDMSSASGPVQRTPVQRSKLSKKSSTKMHGHSHPVYCQGWVGTQNAHNLITVCNDGKLCVWNPDNIDEPIEAQDLKRSALNSNLPVTSIAFADGEMSEFVVGGEDGGLYAVPRYVINPKQRHNDTGSTAMKPKKFEDVHYGPVLGLSSHPRKGEVDLSDLILSCSADWTLKLWHKSTQKSIITFEDSADYVYDVAWSPVHPTVFASIDGASNLSLWNLLSSQEVPVKTEVVNADGAALNCIEWNANGTRVMVGDSVGRCHLFDIGEAFCKPREDSWTALRDMVRELLADNATAS